MNLEIILDSLDIINLGCVNYFNLIFSYTKQYKYCTKIPKYIYIQKKIGYLHLLEDYEYILPYFNFKNLTNLKWLICKNNEITNLELNCPKLEYLDCSNSKVSILNLFNSNNLRYLICKNNEDIVFINHRNIRKLKYLECSIGFLSLDSILKNNNLLYFQILGKTS